MRDVTKAVLGAGEPLLGARRLLAYLSHFFQREAGGTIGLVKPRFGGRELVGGRAAARFGGLDFIDQGAALFGEHRRRRVE